MIPLHEPNISKQENININKCIKSTWISSSGKFIDLFEKKIKKYTKSKYVIAVINGTSALQISLKLAGIRSGDEVIAPAVTFISPINAISYNNAKPIFIDTDKYFNIDQEKVIEFIKKKTFFKKGFTYNKKTKNRIPCILIVHTFGNAAKIDKLIKICKKQNISIIEDAAESLGTFYKQGTLKNKHTGTIGKFGCVSFNGNKIVTSGGGGAILTNSLYLAERARYFISQAKDNPKYYIHNNIGYNYRISNLHAAIGSAQIDKINYFKRKKKRIFLEYLKRIRKIKGLSLMIPPIYSESNYWLNVLNVNEKIFGRKIKKIIDVFEKNSIQARPIWYPINLQKPYKKCEKYKINNTKLALTSICLPSSSQLKIIEINKVISALNE